MASVPTSAGAHRRFSFAGSRPAASFRTALGPFRSGLEAGSGGDVVSHIRHPRPNSAPLIGCRIPRGHSDGTDHMLLHSPRFSSREVSAGRAAIWRRIPSHCSYSHNSFLFFPLRGATIFCHLPFTWHLEQKWVFPQQYQFEIPQQKRHLNASHALPWVRQSWTSIGWHDGHIRSCGSSKPTSASWHSRAPAKYGFLHSWHW
mmetsp:Transcript_15562/g.38384  ORF Transcript_15562/g.38384 Transcript_15562/m.38384 type:complete len:202 (-) Transcript_15562:868-1473(-)